MGKTSDSAKRAFGRELGKNAGKYVSNKIFGDEWSTPYRIAVKQQKAETSLHEHEQEREILASIPDIIFSTDKIEITNVLSKLMSIASTSISLDKQSSDETAQTITKISIDKIEEGIHRLNSIEATYDAEFYQKKLDNLQVDVKKNKRNKWIPLVVGIILLIVLYIFITISEKKKKENMEQNEKYNSTEQRTEQTKENIEKEKENNHRNAKKYYGFLLNDKKEDKTHKTKHTEAKVDTVTRVSEN